MCRKVQATYTVCGHQDESVETCTDFKSCGPITATEYESIDQDCKICVKALKSRLGKSAYRVRVDDLSRPGQSKVEVHIVDEEVKTMTDAATASAVLRAEKSRKLSLE